MEADATQRAKHIPTRSIFIIHGLADLTAPYQHGVALARALTEAGILYRYQVGTVLLKCAHLEPLFISNYEPSTNNITFTYTYLPCTITAVGVYFLNVIRKRDNLISLSMVQMVYLYYKMCYKIMATVVLHRFSSFYCQLIKLKVTTLI